MKPTDYELACRHEAQSRHEFTPNAWVGYLIVMFCGVLFYGTLFLAIRSVYKAHARGQQEVIQALADNTADSNASTK